jgi:ABC-type dipeptide/oligopeptide/nickel transport system ATPase component
MKIGIIGKMCSGKSTVAFNISQFFKEKYNIKLKKISFADKVYELARDIFNMTTKDRPLLQKIGTKFREIDENCWVNYAMKISNSEEHVIIDDGRYLNEINAMKKNGFFLIRLNISNELQEKRIRETYPDTFMEHLNNLNHASEQDITIYPDEYFDHIIDMDMNNLNIKQFIELDDKLDILYSKVLNEKEKVIV